MAASGLEQAVDTYWRSALQFWFLPLRVCRAVTGTTTLQSTTFTAPQAPPAGKRYRLSFTGPLVPGIPYLQRAEAIPESVVRLSPPYLSEGQREFSFLVEGYAVHVLPGATYWSQVVLTDDATGQQIGAPMDVWMVVS